MYRGFARQGTHLRAHDFSKSLGFLVAQHGENQQQKTLELTIYFMEGFEISSECVCVLTFLSLGCNLVMRYELNKKLRNILLLFPIPSHVNGKPTWQSRV